MSIMQRQGLPNFVELQVNSEVTDILMHRINDKEFNLMKLDGKSTTG